MNIHVLSAALWAAIMVAPGLSYATSHGAAQSAPHADQKASASTDGEVRRVNKETKKITIRHGPIAHLEMPAMTMVFQVSDPAMLEQVKAGDKIKFAADKVGGAYTVTHIEPAK
jgi:Cu(I)/Ag(I) efflux system protein CusF